MIHKCDFFLLIFIVKVDLGKIIEGVCIFSDVFWK